MRYEVTTAPLFGPNGFQSIEQTVELVDTKGIREGITRLIINLSDEGVKAALNRLGWHHSSEIAALDIPNPGVDGRYPPVQSYHRVSVRDVQKMEEQIRIIAKTLHL